ncbi:minichromosome maintenance protein MCM, partial [archaeon]|nr:minichromosome maintenance protein MCM [archaeon]
MVNVSQVQQSEEFLRDKCQQSMEELADSYPQKKSLIIEFTELEKHSPELADDLMENPEQIVKALEQAAKDMKVIDSQGKPVEPIIRIRNFPDKDFKYHMFVRDINSDFINKMIVVEGVINKITDVRPKVELAVFECIHCGNKYRIFQNNELYGKLKEPGVCTCQRNSWKLNLEESTFIDMQKMQIQEPLEAIIRGEQAKTIEVWLEGDITNQFYPGDKVITNGTLKLIPPKHKGSVYATYINAVHVEKTEREFEEVELTPKEEKEIEELAKDPEIYDKIIKSVAPSIYGYKEVKEALALQLFGGTKHKVLPDGIKIRPDIHILLIGDPGTAKSQMLSYIYSLAPKGVFVAGKSATGAGLTATAERDEFGDGGWTLKAGALVLASGGHAMIDEFGQMGDEDRSSMHEAMEQQRISIAKAGIVTTFKAETAILAASNPKFGRFDPFEPPAGQFNIPPALLSRFDLIFPIRDIIDEETDKNMAEHILTGHQTAGVKKHQRKGILTKKQLEEAEKKITPIIDAGFLRKYIAYSRKRVYPVLTTEATKKIKDY